MAADPVELRGLLHALLKEIQDSRGDPRTERFADLRAVDAKVREFRLLLGSMPGGATDLRAEVDTDESFKINSRRVRLQALGHHCRTALKFLETSVVKKSDTVLTRGPNLRALTSTVPELERIIQERWLEVQRCQYAKAYFAAIVLMGSILEALLLSRAFASPADANRASRAPKSREGKNLPLQDWSLAQLIDVATELGWLKVDRGKFAHALRDSRNVVHPWHHAQIRADFDAATCEMSWQVLRSSVDDLIRSI